MLRARALAVAGLVLAACSPGQTQTQSVLTLNSTGSRLVAPGTAIKLTVFGRTIAGDQTTPAAGVSVALTATHGTLSASTVALGADGKGTVTFTTCKAGDDGCIDGANAVVSASATIGGTATKSSSAFTIAACDTTQADYCQSDACDQEACTDGTGAAGKCSQATHSCVTGTVANGDYALAVGFFNDAGDRPRPAMRAAAGGPAFKIVAAVTDKDGHAAPGQKVDFAVQGGIGGLALTSDATDFADTAQQTTDEQGHATAWLKPGAQPANGIVSVSLDGTALAVDTPFDTTIPGTLVFVPPASDPAFGIMGVKTSGYREQQVLTFELLDSTGAPYTGEATLKFAIVTTGGASIAPETAAIDANGQASVTVYSGTSAGTIAVHAKAYLGTDTSATAKVIAETSSPTLAIVGAKASGKNFAVRCKDASIPALAGNDCTFLRADIHETCTAVVGDRFNNRLGAGGEITWHTEAGLFGPPSHLPVADPTTTDDGTLGRTDNTLTTLNTRMPLDVPPMPNEFRRPADPNETCLAADGSPLQRNLRDGLVTFIVTTQGEEGFDDANGNGMYDEGENFYDQGEPYIDANDNNQFDPGETFIDENQNGQYDGPNGKWDADTTIWAVGHLMMTGVGSMPENSPAGLLAPPNTQSEVDVLWRDRNGNSPSLAFTTFGVKTIGDGSATLLSGDKFVDTFGSVDVSQVRTLNGHAWLTQTKLGFPGGQTGGGIDEAILFKAPGTAPFSGIIDAQATTTVGAETVIANSDIPVSSTAAP